CPIAKVFEDGQTHRSVRGNKSGKGPRYLEVVASPLKAGNSEGGEITAAVETVRDITERVVALRQMEESQKMLEGIANGISESILLLTTDRKILWANAAAKRQAGRDITGEFCHRVTHRRESPCGANGEPCPLSDLQVYEAPRFVEHAHHDCNGGKTVLEVGAYPLKNEAGEIDKFIHISRDITERKQVEEALKKYRDHLEEQVRKRTAELTASQKRYRLLFETASDAILIIDAEDDEGKIVDANEAAARMHGYTIEELLKLDIGDVDSPEEAGRHPGRRGLMLKGQRMQAELMHRRKDGAVFPVEISANAFEQGGRKYILAIERDITERRKVEDRIRAAIEEREILLKELHHRTKNNMQVISSLLQLQFMSCGDSRLHQIFEDTQSRINAMSLVHERLYRSKELSRLDMARYIADLSMALMKGYLKDAANVSVKLEVDGIPLPLEFAIPCGLVINELLTNSLKYAFPGQREGEIRIALHKHGEDEIRLLFSDNGVGLPEGLDLKDAKTLGLKLVRTLVTGQMQGKLEVSRENGTTFAISFSPGQANLHPKTT
ncbi:MAG: PAS domain S-box protein, partial [Nitrospiraceae bacterium]|nr:PAS domain S-box protein [Nitrospiraceae bacterium]